MELKEAHSIACKYLEIFRPYCERIEIAGSIRREKPDIGDIELVCIPKTFVKTEIKPGDLFETATEKPVIIRDEKFIRLVDSYPRTRGKGSGKYAQLLLPENIKLDLFMCVPENWGLIFMIRTGSAAFSEDMVSKIKGNGFYSEGGFLKRYSDNENVTCYEEKEFFSITGMKWVDPKNR